VRRVKRSQLDAATVRKLNEKQADANQKRADDKLDVEAHWKAARKTKPLATVLSHLKAMTGIPERCMYCLDSHGTDIDHFWPKSIYPGKMYRWQNHLLNCTECGPIKGIKFPLQGGEPMLIDPTVEEPWLYLDFDPTTGNITSRYDVNKGDWSQQGAATVDVLELDRREALAHRHLKTFRRISSRVKAYLEDHKPPAAVLIERMQDDDDHDLLGWCVYGDGGNTEPFHSLREQHPDVWHSLQVALSQNRS